jgi:hypothetical protein
MATGTGALAAVMRKLEISGMGDSPANPGEATETKSVLPPAVEPKTHAIPPLAPHVPDASV